MMRGLRVLIAGLAAICLSVPSAVADEGAGFYVWQSEDGVIHITDTAPKSDDKGKVYLLPHDQEDTRTIAIPSRPTPPPTSGQPGVHPDHRLGETDLEGKDEAWWRARKQLLLQKRRQYQAIYDSYAQRLRKGDLEEAQLRRMIKKKLKVYREKIAEMDRALVNLVDEARRAGAMPGWIRD
jgi:hypothetical protein